MVTKEEEHQRQRLTIKILAPEGAALSARFLITAMFRNYRPEGKLLGHSGAVYSIVATDDGKCLASGGNDGTRIWDLQRMPQIPNRPASSGIRGATTAIAWTNLDDEPGEMLFYGTITGFLISWRQVPPSEVTALAFDTTSNRLAVCNYNSSVQIYTLASSAKPCKTFAVNIANFIPNTVHFGAMHGNERELLVFGLHDGKIRTLTGSSEIDSSSEPWEIGVHIGDAAVDTRRMTVCIDDTEHGAILYRLDDHQRVKTFPVPVTQAKRPRQVRFLDDSRAIVIGSDHGIVYIFDRRTGDIIDKLAVRGESWVQTLACKLKGFFSKAMDQAPSWDLSDVLSVKRSTVAATRKNGLNPSADRETVDSGTRWDMVGTCGNVERIQAGSVAMSADHDPRLTWAAPRLPPSPTSKLRVRIVTYSLHSLFRATGSYLRITPYTHIRTASTLEKSRCIHSLYRAESSSVSLTLAPRCHAATSLSPRMHIALPLIHPQLALTLDAHATPPPPPGHCSTAHPPLCGHRCALTSREGGFRSTPVETYLCILRATCTQREKLVGVESDLHERLVASFLSLAPRSGSKKMGLREHLQLNLEIADRLRTRPDGDKEVWKTDVHQNIRSPRSLVISIGSIPIANSFHNTRMCN
ncbi:WD40-repeat-containing domain protein [Mycena maculata]|uniref:WD40-repeat-containing domain protein n=1 Tax=Mycena maculata TaxID=230809 RepID=A0AAD7MTM7_9AGAR|nr:WD40-repeat-containing domain protein [Mycena maculata]